MLIFEGREKSMEGFMERIKNYGEFLDTLELSPFETVFALYLRTDLEKEVNNMTNKERLKLYQYDLFLLEYIEELEKHLNAVCDFSNSKEPIEHWWWHMDKINKNNRLKEKMIDELTKAVAQCEEEIEDEQLSRKYQSRLDLPDDQWLEKPEGMSFSDWVRSFIEVEDEKKKEE